MMTYENTVRMVAVDNYFNPVSSINFEDIDSVKNHFVYVGEYFKDYSHKPELFITTQRKQFIDELLGVDTVRNTYVANGFLKQMYDNCMSHWNSYLDHDSWRVALDHRCVIEFIANCAHYGYHILFY